MFERLMFRKVELWVVGLMSLRRPGVFLSLAVRSVLVLLVSVAPIWGAEQTGVAEGEDVIGLLSRWDVILGSTIAICALYLLKVRLRRQG